MPITDTSMKRIMQGADKIAKAMKEREMMKAKELDSHQLSGTVTINLPGAGPALDSAKSMDSDMERRLGARKGSAKSMDSDMERKMFLRKR